MNYEVGNPNIGWLALFSIVAVGLFVWSRWISQRSLSKFVSGTQLKEMSTRRAQLCSLLAMLCQVASLVLLAVALMDIRWGETTYEIPQKGIEVVFALDVSRSMLAEDAVPNRLERAKQQIKDMVDEMAGDRVGLVVFAGDAIQAVPLTKHYEDFKQTLDSVGPHSLLRGGSQLSVAIETANEAFLGKTNDHRTIVLFTDGEDQESQPVKLARKLNAENGTRIFTVGLGDMDQGARIPDAGSRRNAFVEHQGQQVWSKLNGRILRDIATESGAAYIPAGTKQVNMAEVYHAYIAKIGQKEFETASINALTPRFQGFAGLAILFLFLEVVLKTTRFSQDKKPSERAKSRLAQSAEQREMPMRNHSSKLAKSGTAAVWLCLLLPTALPAQEPSVVHQINEANQLVRQQKPKEAIDAYSHIRVTDAEQQSRLDYNLAVAHYRNSDFSAASVLFEQAAKSTNNSIAADSRYNLGNCHYAQALPLKEEQPKQAVEGLEKAVQLYRSALRLDRNNNDARRNIELARRLIEQLKREQEQDEQKPDQQEQDQDQENQEESNDAQNSEQQSGEQSEDPSGQPQDESQETKQGNPADEQREASDQSAQQGKPNNEPGEDQQPTEQEGDGEASNQPPQGELSSENQKPEGEAQPGRQANRVGSNQEEGLLTREEALKMLQAVRDRDMLRRDQRQRRERSRRVPVERDW